eukprot:NODE_6_length_70510_cov_1.054395.p9 type:complete len:557 gc:universal NODE_6_length_70510_cov_1.054395:7609-9279(+)
MIGTIDIAICSSLLVLLFLFSFYKKSSKAEYFKFKSKYWLIGPSLMAANIGAEHFVGQIAAAASTGVGVILYEWYAAYLLLLLGWIFAVYYRHVVTVPEYIEKRFNSTTRVLCAFIQLFAATVVKISSSVYAAGILFETLLQWDAQISVAIILIFTGLYTIIGGLSAVMYTDLAQLSVFLVGGLTASCICINLFGDLPALFDVFYATEKGYLLKIFRGLDDPNYSPIGMLLGQVFASMWYWCLDQEMVQRANSGETIDDSRLGTTIAGYLKVLPYFIIIIPGLAARALYESCQAGIPIDKNEIWCNLRMDDGEVANKAYAYLMLYVFPTGLTGIILGGIFASMTASLSACFHASSTVFSIDIYQRIFRRNSSDSELVVVGRIFTIFMIILGILWTNVLANQHNSIYLVTQMVMNHISPVLTTIVVWGMVSQKITSLAANIGLIFGVLLGLFRLSWHLLNSELCEAASTPTHLGGPLLACMHSNYFAIVLFFVVSAILWIVSTLKPEQSKFFPKNDNVGLILFEKRRSKSFQSFTKFAGIFLVVFVTSLITFFVLKF